MREIPEGTLCENCNKNLATGRWIGQGGVLALTRYHMQRLWCERCMLTEQVKYAKGLSKKLTKWEKKLKKLGGPWKGNKKKSRKQLPFFKREEIVGKGDRINKGTDTEAMGKNKPETPKPGKVDGENLKNDKSKEEEVSVVLSESRAEGEKNEPKIDFPEKELEVDTVQDRAQTPKSPRVRVQRSPITDVQNTPSTDVQKTASTRVQRTPRARATSKIPKSNNL